MCKKSYFGSLAIIAKVPLQIKHLGTTQVKCLLLISSIFDAMNLQHFLLNVGNSLHQKC